MGSALHVAEPELTEDSFHSLRHDGAEGICFHLGSPIGVVISSAANTFVELREMPPEYKWVRQSIYMRKLPMQ